MLPDLQNYSSHNNMVYQNNAAGVQNLQDQDDLKNLEENLSSEADQVSGNDQTFPDISHLIPTTIEETGEEPISGLNANNITNSSNRKRSIVVIGENLEQEPALKKTKFNSQEELPWMKLERMANLQFFGTTIVELIENSLNQGNEAFIEVLNVFPDCLNLEFDIPFVQKIIFQVYGNEIPMQTVFWQLCAANLWDLIGTILQTSVALNLDCHPYCPDTGNLEHRLILTSPLSMAICNERWDIAARMLEPPYKPFIGPIFNMLPIAVAMRKNNWDFVRKLLNYDREALNIANMEKYLPYDHIFSERENAKENLFELMELYPISNSLISHLLVECLDWAHYDEEGLQEIIELKPNLHMCQVVMNFIHLIEDNKEYISDFIKTICKKFNIDSYFTQDSLAKIFRHLCKHSNLWSKNIKAGKEIFYKAIFQRIRVCSYRGLRLHIKDLINSCESMEQKKLDKDWVIGNKNLWNLNEENKVVLKPVLRNILNTQEVMTNTFQALFYATAAHVNNPFFDSLPQDVYHLIAQEIFRSVPELATLSFKELMGVLAQWNRYGKSMRAFSGSISR